MPHSINEWQRVSEQSAEESRERRESPHPFPYGKALGYTLMLLVCFAFWLGIAWVLAAIL